MPLKILLARSIHPTAKRIVKKLTLRLKRNVHPPQQLQERSLVQPLGAEIRDPEVGVCLAQADEAGNVLSQFFEAHLGQRVREELDDGLVGGFGNEERVVIDRHFGGWWVVKMFKSSS